MSVGLLVVLLVIALGACSDTTAAGFGTESGGGFGGATFIVKVAGDLQRGRAGERLPQPFQVLVVDDLNQPRANVPLQWTLTSGGGSLSDTLTRTDPGGRSSVFLTLGPELEAHEVVVRPRGEKSITLTEVFEADATVMPVRTVDFEFRGPSGGSGIRVSVGDTIEWVNPDTLAHTVTARSSPEGGALFDSGRLEPDDSFRFVPQAAGRWRYVCRLHPGFGAEGTIEVE